MITKNSNDKKQQQKDGDWEKRYEKD